MAESARTPRTHEDALLRAATAAIHDVDCPDGPACTEVTTLDGRYARYARGALSAFRAWTLPDPELMARRFHEAYERLAPDFGYRTRESSARPWDEVPDRNRALMVATCEEIRDWLLGRVMDRTPDG